MLSERTEGNRKISPSISVYALIKLVCEANRTLLLSQFGHSIGSDDVGAAYSCNLKPAGMSKMTSRNILCGCVNHLRDLHVLEVPFYYWGEQGARSVLSSEDYL